MESRQRSGLRIQTRLSVYFASLAIVATAAITLAIFLVFARQIRQNIKSRLTDAVTLASLADRRASTRPQSLHPKTKTHRPTKPSSTPCETSSDPPMTSSTSYTWRITNNGQLAFVVDADLEEPADIGEIYEDIDPETLNQLISIKTPFTDQEFTSDRWGTFLSGYAPFYHPDGRLEGILGIDIDASDVLAYERKSLWARLSALRHYRGSGVDRR